MGGLPESLRSVPRGIRGTWRYQGLFRGSQGLSGSVNSFPDGCQGRFRMSQWHFRVPQCVFRGNLEVFRSILKGLNGYLEVSGTSGGPSRFQSVSVAYRMGVSERYLTVSEALQGAAGGTL